jgi:hypothetical protein
MSSEGVIRPARADELAAVLSLRQESGVIPLGVTDSIEGLTRLIVHSAVFFSSRPSTVFWLVQ